MLRIAAAFLVAAAGIATFAVSRQISQTGTRGVDTVEVATGIDAQTGVKGSAPSGLGVVSVSALSNDQLEELIDEVPTLDALPSTQDAAQFLEFDPLAGLSVIEIGEI